MSLVPDEVPFTIPEKWKWVELSKVATFDKTQVKGGCKVNTWVLELEDIEKNTGKLLQRRIVDNKIVSDRSSFKLGDVLYSKLRPYLNKVIIADQNGLCSTEIVPIQCNKTLLEPRYLQVALMSSTFLSYANSLAYGVKMPRLSPKDLKKWFIPVPPLEEQKRIIEKIKVLCDEIDEVKPNCVLD